MWGPISEILQWISYDVLLCSLLLSFIATSICDIICRGILYIFSKIPQNGAVKL